MFENLEIVKEIFGYEKMDMSKIYEFMIREGINKGELRDDLDIEFVSKSIHTLSLNLVNEFIKVKEDSFHSVIEKTGKNLIELFKMGISK